MSSGRHEHTSTFPPVPPSLSAGEYELRDLYNDQTPQRNAPHTAPSITPYLGLRARLSQVWINRWTILLLLVLVRTLLAVSSINYDLDSAKREALSACSGVEAMGSAMASMPHYMSQGVNALTATGVEKAVNGLMSMIGLSVTGVEELVVFFVNLLTSTYVCLITLAVSGSLHAQLNLLEDAAKLLNQTLGAASKDIHAAVNDFEDSWNKLAGGINDIGGFLGSSKTLPEFDNSSLNALDNVNLPSSLTDGLAKLNKSIPTFTQVNNFTNTILRLPFEEVKTLINSTMVGYKFDQSVFPVPQKEQLTFCSDNNGINDFFNDIHSLVLLARKVFIGVLLVLAILACVPMAWQEVRRWHTMQQHAQLVHQEALDPMDVVYIASRPYTATAGIKAASRFKSSRRQVLVRWVIAYATSMPALFVLSLGVAGLFACACQAILLKTIEKEVPQLTNQVGAFSEKVVNALNNASEQWAIGTNHAIQSTNTDINQQVFGWVNTTTGALNDTLNTFVADMSNVLNETFGGTILYGPITEVLNCLITLKIEGIQKGLTWVSDNAHIDFPLLPNDTFSVGAVASIASDNPQKSDSFLALPGDTASDQVSEAVVRLTTRLEDGIRTEALISTFIVLIWVLIVLFGLVRALTLFYGRDKNRGEGGVAYTVNRDVNGFETVDLGHAKGIPQDPAPRYSAAAQMSGARDAGPFADPTNNDDYYQARKLGFAGQRNYDTALKGGHSRSSSYVEFGRGEEKR
jgi:hypothetical protein